MREVLLNNLFRIISSLRRIEIGLINERKLENAARVRQVNKALSGFRDKLITAQLTEATDKLTSAADQLQVTAGDLQSYLNAREAATGKLDAILSNLPAVIELLSRLY